MLSALIMDTSSAWSRQVVCRSNFCEAQIWDTLWSKEEGWLMFSWPELQAEVLFNWLLAVLTRYTLVRKSRSIIVRKSRSIFAGNIVASLSENLVASLSENLASFSEKSCSFSVGKSRKSRCIFVRKSCCIIVKTSMLENLPQNLVAICQEILLHLC